GLVQMNGLRFGDWTNRFEVHTGCAELQAQGHDLKSTRSATSRNSSIATSPPPLPARVGPTHFLGCATFSTQLHTVWRRSSSRVIVTVRGLYTPSRVSLSHENSLRSPMTPRFRVISSVALTFGTLRTW